MDKVHGFEIDTVYFDHVEREDRSPDRWSNLDSVQPSPSFSDIARARAITPVYRSDFTASGVFPVHGTRAASAPRVDKRAQPFQAFPADAIDGPVIANADPAPLDAPVARPHRRWAGEVPK